jgi:hypothetical protein
MQIGRFRSITLALSTLALLGLVGCASTKPKGILSNSQDGKSTSSQSEAAIAGPSPTIEQPRVAARVALAPEWFLNPPKQDRMVFAASTAVSADMQLALEKAVLNAQHALASQLSNAVSGQLKSFALERGVTDLDSISAETEKVVREQVSEVNLGGYAREKTEILATNDGFRAFVLLSYNLDHKVKPRPANVSSNKRSVDDRAKKAFEDLERSVTVTPVQ